MEVTVYALLENGMTISMNIVNFVRINAQNVVYKVEIAQLVEEIELNRQYVYAQTDHMRIIKV